MISATVCGNSGASLSFSFDNVHHFRVSGVSKNK